MPCKNSAFIAWTTERLGNSRIRLAEYSIKFVVSLDWDTQTSSLTYTNTKLNQK